MFLENDKYQVKITVDSAYKKESIDYQYYDFINTGENENGKNSEALRIEIDNCGKKSFLALAGNVNDSDDNFAVLEDDVLTILQDKKIIRVNLSENKITLCKEINCFGNNFGIYICTGGYIVYGETSVIKLNNDLAEEWSFSGNDIFVTQNGTPAFMIDDNRIKLYDWNYAYYELDFDGNLIRSIYADNTDMDFQI